MSYSKRERSGRYAKAVNLIQEAEDKVSDALGYCDPGDDDRPGVFGSMDRGRCLQAVDSLGALRVVFANRAMLLDAEAVSEERER